MAILIFKLFNILSLDLKILNGLERLSDVFKSLLWEKAKLHGISPIQIQILLFVSTHPVEISNVSALAREFSVTKATISDAVRVLIKKELLSKDHSPADNRRYNLLLTYGGQEVVDGLSDYAAPIAATLEAADSYQKEAVYQLLYQLVDQLHQQGIIQVQRSCFNCRFYEGDKQDQHFCGYLKKALSSQQIRLDCSEFESR
jgi:DNA-binding MarR family transcriptional regulator